MCNISVFFSVVEEVLGHLYAKPPSAELKNETQSSGITCLGR